MANSCCTCCRSVGGSRSVESVPMVCGGSADETCDQAGHVVAATIAKGRMRRKSIEGAASGRNEGETGRVDILKRFYNYPLVK